MSDQGDAIALNADLADRYPALARLIGLAVRNPHIMHLLLTTPDSAVALAPVYFIRLNASETALVKAVGGAPTIQEFVSRLEARYLDRP